MRLLTPLALWGLLTIPAILLLHLLRSRREQQLVASLRLWAGLEQKRQGGRPRTIPLSWLLALQLIAAAAIALSLARPVQSFLLARPQHLIVLLDTTTSMTAEDAPGQARRFDAARQIVSDQLQNLADDDAFAFITLNDDPQIWQRGLGAARTAAMLALDKLVPGATGLKLDAALTLANGLIMADPDRPARIVIVTDGAFSPPEALPPVLAPITWQFVPDGPPAAGNQALLNVSATRLPDGRHRLFARLINYSDESVNRTVRVTTTGAEAGDTRLTLPPQGEAAQAWTLPAAAESVSVEIVEPDSLPLDNRAELLLTGGDNRQVLLVSEQPDLLRRAFEAQPGVNLTATTALTDFNPAEFDLTVFDGPPPALTAWPPGSVLVVNPQPGQTLLPVTGTVRNLYPNPDSAGDLLTGVDLSGVYFGRATDITLPEWAAVELESFSEPPRPLIFGGTVGNSRVMVWAFEPAASNLPDRLALPLLTANTLEALTRPSLPETAGAGQTITLNRTFSVELPGGRLMSPPETGGSTYQFEQTRQPGLYRVYQQDGRIAGGFAVHAGSALEANVGRRLDPAALKLIDMEQPGLTGPETAEAEFWPWLAGLALVVVAGEGWLVWRS